MDGIRAGLADAARAYEIRTSASVLAERDRGLTERLSGVAAQVAAETTPVRDLATALLATPDGQSDDTRAAAVTAAEQAKTAADGHCAVTETALNTAQTTLTQVTAVRTEAPRRTLPVRPTSAEHADALAAEQNSPPNARRKPVPPPNATWPPCKPGTPPWPPGARRSPCFRTGYPTPPGSPPNRSPVTRTPLNTSSNAPAPP